MDRFARVTTLDTATFKPESFTWQGGAFVLTGRWSDAASGLGRVRLFVDVDGRQRNLGAQGGKMAGGEDWRATFICAHEPDPGATALLKVGGEEIPLPPPALAAEPAEEKEAVALIDKLRAERDALDQARHALAGERRAAEEVEARLNALRRRGGFEAEPAAEYRWLGYVVGGAIALLFLLVLVWVL
jgi:hypothetical protein